ncbi:MAG: tetratricopeptide repeat protein, partial [Pseudothermotoga sp.]
DCYLEYGDWGVSKEMKEKTLEQARKYAEEAVKLDGNNGRAHYIAGASIGRLAQYKGIIQSLFMLGDFDKYINKAISLLNESDEEQRLYKTFALIALGMRYRDVPWPLNDYKKSEELLLSAAQLTPNYSNIYLELGSLYAKTGKKDKAREMFQKVIESEPHPLLIGAHQNAIKTAQEELEKIK